MSVSYFATWVGTLNQSRIDKNGQDEALGLIDISGVPSHPSREHIDTRGKKHFGFDWASCCIDVFSPAGDKLSLANHYVPIMRANDLTSIGSFVNLLAAPEDKTPQELARAYEATGNIICWRRADHHWIAYW